MRLHQFQSGLIRTKKRLIVKDGGDKSFVVSVPFFLIEHPQGRLLFDCGQPLSAVDDDKKPPLDRDYVSIMTEADYAPNQLRSAGIAPESINYLVMSHLHSDHAGLWAPSRTRFILSNDPNWNMETISSPSKSACEDSYDVFGKCSAK